MRKGKIEVERIRIGREVIDKAYQLGFEYEKTKHACSQCVVATLEEVLQIEDEGIFQAAYPLAGGLGSTTEGTCGALSGGAMILGYLWGRSRAEFEKNTSNKRATDLAKELYQRFIQEYGSCRCKDIQIKLFGRSFNFYDEENRKAFEKAGGHEEKCPLVVAKACQWTCEIIRDQIAQ